MKRVTLKSKQLHHLDFLATVVYMKIMTYKLYYDLIYKKGEKKRSKLVEIIEIHYNIIQFFPMVLGFIHIHLQSP